VEPNDIPAKSKSASGRHFLPPLADVVLNKRSAGGFALAIIS